MCLRSTGQSSTHRSEPQRAAAQIPYLMRLLENGAAVRNLKQRQSDVLEEFEATVKTVALDQ